MLGSFDYLGQIGILKSQIMNSVLYVLFLLDPQNNLIIVILQVRKVKLSKVIMTCPSHAFNWILLSTNPLLFIYLFYLKGANMALSKDFASTFSLPHL